MAQIGCFVPATYFEHSIVDRIFIRMGGSDKIISHKSTFFVEMEETFVIKFSFTFIFLILF